MWGQPMEGEATRVGEGGFTVWGQPMEGEATRVGEGGFTMWGQPSGVVLVCCA